MKIYHISLDLTGEQRPLDQWPLEFLVRVQNHIQSGGKVTFEEPEERDNVLEQLGIVISLKKQDLL